MVTFRVPARRIESGSYGNPLVMTWFHIISKPSYEGIFADVLKLGIA